MSLSRVVNCTTVGREEIRPTEVAAAIIEFALEQLAVSRETYDAASEAKQVMWRGATAWARDFMKKPEMVDALLNTQEELDYGSSYSEFVWVGSDEDGAIWARRRTLTRERYETMLSLLETKRDELSAKLRKYRVEYETALRCWSPGLTFGEAMRAVSDSLSCKQQ